jgi:hypothetical protein
MEGTVRAAFVDQAAHCDRLGSPFTALLCRVLAEHLDASTATSARVLTWPDDCNPSLDVLPLRLAGGLHALARSGRAPFLAAVYPPAEPTPDALWRGLEHALAAYDDELLPWLDGPPQTNEVARSAVLWTGLLHVTATLGENIELLELGASAGLNLVLDAYAYDLGGRMSGDATSALRLSPHWEGPAPPHAKPVIVARRGVDVNPLDVTRPDHRERLAAYIWADQRARLDRIEQALAIAARRAPPIDCGDAADWLDARLAEPTQPGITRVVQHSIAFQYFSAESRRRIADSLSSAGAQATPDTPLVWLSFETRQDATLGADLRLTCWPGGSEIVLADADPHARRIVSQLGRAAIPGA